MPAAFIVWNGVGMTRQHQATRAAAQGRDQVGRGRAAGQRYDFHCEAGILEPAGKQVDNSTVTPHFAWYSEESAAELQEQAVEAVVQVLQGGWPRAVVNPEVKER